MSFDMPSSGRPAPFSLSLPWGLTFVALYCTTYCVLCIYTVKRTSSRYAANQASACAGQAPRPSGGWYGGHFTPGFCAATLACCSSSNWLLRLLKCQALGAVMPSAPATSGGAHLQARTDGCAVGASQPRMHQRADVGYPALLPAPPPPPGTLTSPPRQARPCRWPAAPAARRAPSPLHGWGGGKAEGTCRT